VRVGLADPLPWGIAAAVTGHVLFALTITPDYVTFVLPFGFKYYTQIGGSGAVEVLTGRYILPALIACAFAALLAPAVLRPRVAPIAALFAFGAALAAVAQGKGWAYQSYPVMAMAAVAMAATVAGLVDRHVPLSGRAGHRARFDRHRQRDAARRRLHRARRRVHGFEHATRREPVVGRARHGEGRHQHVAAGRRGHGRCRVGESRRRGLAGRHIDRRGVV
jgi:hypothetical protein